ncbi:m33.1 protein [Murid betaherpesvirus 1]|uniref:M33.1 n=2 Tax=Murid herpesvirus 1 TaxID=10366 RepID=A0A7D5KDW3_MUHV1|nr:m33.1 protein [Murid betaherpesvirus 1]QLF98949.1 m33.1 [Muromegalovirus G4]QNL29179.1 m33.1 [Muromegalovirus G4]CCE56540.1 m33.1 protein [Murid betaherpesvirus 1]CCE56707.1 m33.1 protein [Murid betaherpesvirus 1]
MKAPRTPSLLLLSERLLLRRLCRCLPFPPSVRVSSAAGGLRERGSAPGRGCPDRPNVRSVAPTPREADAVSIERANC